MPADYRAIANQANRDAEHQYRLNAIVRRNNIILGNTALDMPSLEERIRKTALRGEFRCYVVTENVSFRRKLFGGKIPAPTGWQEEVNLKDVLEPLIAYIQSLGCRAVVDFSSWTRPGPMFMEIFADWS